MFCSFCGKKIRDNALFCSECGHKLTENETTTKNSEKTIWVQILTIIIVVIIVTAVVMMLLPPSPVGVWMNGTDKIVFTKDGDYKRDSNYGTYIIETDKSLKIEFGDFSWSSGYRTYDWGPEAKTDSDYWYISGGTLYIHGCAYKKI